MRIGGRCIGVELTGDTARAVVLSPWGRSVTGTAEVPFDPARPAEAVAALRAQLGQPATVVLAVGYAHLYLNAVRLPPVSRAQRLAIVGLEPDRFFPVAGRLAIALLADDLACAAEAEPLERWVAAFADWGRIAAVHAAPAAVARAFARTMGTSGAFAVAGELSNGETAIVELDEGRLRGARRLPAGVDVSSASLPPLRGVSPRFVGALGAALGARASLDDQLLSPPLRDRLRRDRMRRRATAAALLAAALLLATCGVDRSRETALRDTEREIGHLSATAAPALTLSARVVAMQRESETSGTSPAAQGDVVQLLAALSERLPRDATVLALSVDGDEWRIDGRASNAAAIVPALDADPRFGAVRLAGPTSRFTEGARTYESFSVAFRAGTAR